MARVRFAYISSPSHMVPVHAMSNNATLNTSIHTAFLCHDCILNDPSATVLSLTIIGAGMSAGLRESAVFINGQFVPAIHLSITGGSHITTKLPGPAR